MLKRYAGDLHVHTVLSPCAHFDMAPSLVVARARSTGLQMIGVTDHNSAENAWAVMEAARGTGVTVLPGLEVETREEVHVLALFPDVARALQWQGTVYSHLPDFSNDEERLGVQVRVGPRDEVLGTVTRRLLTATDLSLEEVLEGVATLGGLCVPSHVDRQAYGLLGVLGFIPEGADIPAVEVSPHCPKAMLQQLQGRVILRSSDAHFLDALGTARSEFWLAAPTLEEVALACRGLGGRRVVTA